MSMATGAYFGERMHGPHTLDMHVWLQAAITMQPQAR